MPHEKLKSKSLAKTQMSTVKVSPEFEAEAGWKWLMSQSDREKEKTSSKLHQRPPLWWSCKVPKEPGHA